MMAYRIFHLPIFRRIKGGGVEINPPPSRSLRYRKKRGPERVKKKKKERQKVDKANDKRSQEKGKTYSLKKNFDPFTKSIFLIRLEQNHTISISMEVWRLWTILSGHRVFILKCKQGRIQISG